MLTYILIVALLRYSKAFTSYYEPQMLLQQPPGLEERQTLPNGILGWRNPFVSLINRLPIIRNPESTGIGTSYGSCETSKGESGICLSSIACFLQGGRISGSCRLATVCCVNTIVKCSGIVTVNNTYWRSPASGISASASTACAITVRLDQGLFQQKQFSVCQLRLDILQFITAQPRAGVCSIDSFTVSGGNNDPPVICGDNDDQHMYIHVPPSSETRTDVALTFSFGGGGDTARSWNIKVSMIPCGASYAAPPDCLQYYTGISGTVKSFNYAPVASSTRELVNQAHSICFSTEIINGQRANEIIYDFCRVNQGGSAFAVSGSSPTSSWAEEQCTADYVGLTGYLIFLGLGVPVNRICGGLLNFPLTFKSNSRPFSLTVKTDADEPAASDGNNGGFCFEYNQRVTRMSSFAFTLW